MKNWLLKAKFNGLDAFVMVAYLGIPMLTQKNVFLDADLVLFLVYLALRPLPKNK